MRELETQMQGQAGGPPKIPSPPHIVFFQFILVCQLDLHRQLQWRDENCRREGEGEGKNIMLINAFLWKTGNVYLEFLQQEVMQRITGKGNGKCSQERIKLKGL